MRRGIWRSGAKVAYGSCAALIAIAILGYSPTGRAVPTTLLPGQTLELDFPLIPALSSANALTFGWTSSYTGSSTTKLFSDGPDALGRVHWHSHRRILQGARCSVYLWDPS